MFRQMRTSPALDTGHKAADTRQTLWGHLEMTGWGSSGGQRDHRSLLGNGRRIFGSVAFFASTNVQLVIREKSSHLISSVDWIPSGGEEGEDIWAGAAEDTRH